MSGESIRRAIDGRGGCLELIAGRPRFFAAAASAAEAAHRGRHRAIDAPLWVFQGAADDRSRSLSRDRIAAGRKAGGHPLYTEYAGVDHNCWEWAFTEPELVKWLFAQRRG